MTIFEVSVKLELIEKPSDTFALTFTSEQGFYECWEKIEVFKKTK